MRPLRALITKNNLNKAYKANFFTKENLECGTIVGFKDGTLGVYVDGSLAEYIEEKFNFVLVSGNKIILTYDPDEDNGVGYFTIGDYTENLEYSDRDYHEYDIVRIYDRVLKENKIKDFTENFYEEIPKIAKGMKYIERQ